MARKSAPDNHRSGPRLSRVSAAEADAGDGALPKGSPRQEAKALFRSSVLQAAEQVFAEKGFHSARIQEIAERARVGVGTVYNHFAQKEEILLELMRSRMQEAAHAFEPSPDDPSDFEGRLLARFRRLNQFFSTHRACFAMSCEQGAFSALPTELSKVLQEHAFGERATLLQNVRELLAEGVAEGALEPADPLLLQRFLGGAMRELGLGALRDNSDEQAASEFALKLFLRATRRTRT